MSEVLSLIGATMSPNNNERMQSEIRLNELCQQDPDTFLYSLDQAALNTALDGTLRLAALLALKRYVPKYWSPAFDSYVGPSTVNQEVKRGLRESLLQLLGESSSKLRNAAAYAVVQIAAVDYPDEWPQLMDDLYAPIVNNTGASEAQVLGSLRTMKELFDDLVTDDQFFQGGVALGVMKACESLLANPDTDIEVRVATLPLVRTIINTMQDVVYYDDADKTRFVDTVVPRMLDLLSTLSTSVSQAQFVNSIMLWNLKKELYDCLNALLDSFSRFFAGKEQDLTETVMGDLQKEQDPYLAIFCNSSGASSESVMNSGFNDLETFKESQTEATGPSDVILGAVRNEAKFLMGLLELHPLNDQIKVTYLIDILTVFNYITMDRLEDYQADFNEFVTDETDLSIDSDVRSSIVEFFTELNGTDIDIAVEVLTTRVIDTMHAENIAQNLRTLESLVLLLTCAFDNESGEGKPQFSLKSFFDLIMAFIRDIFASQLNKESEMLLSRFILMLPKFLMRYDEDLKQLAVPSLKQVTAYFTPLTDPENFQLLKASMLISFQYYNQFVRAKEFDPEIQFTLITLINQLKEDAEEDTNIMMLEALTILICIDNRSLCNSKDCFELIMAIGYKDCSNFSMNTPTLECVSDLIKDVSVETYMSLSAKVLPSLFTIVRESDGEYKPDVDLTLQVLTEYLKGPTDDFEIPHDLFIYAFPLICQFIIGSTDDNLLQSASLVFNEIVRRSTKEVEQYRDPDTGVSGNEMLLQIVSKFLAPGVSDRAIVNLGSLVVLIIDNFGDSELIKQYFESMLRGVTVRLISSKEVLTIENMILIFNKLMSTHPQDTLAFLKTFKVDDDGSTALQKILPIWFQAFEVMRGYDRILNNIKAFTELLKLNDPSTSAIIVNGEPLPNQVPDGMIITRSMSKRMEVQYEKIPADAKIVRLLVNELRVQVQSDHQAEADALNAAKPAINACADHTHTADDNGDADDDSDGWEDVDDLTTATYAELQNYVSTPAATGRTNSSIREYLVQFFKECFAGKVTRFQEIYTSYLKEEDRRVLTEWLV